MLPVPTVAASAVVTACSGVTAPAPASCFWNLADRVLHRVAKARELDPTVADRQVQTADDRTWQENIQPGDGIQCTGKEIDDSFHMFSFPDAPRPSFSFS